LPLIHLTLRKERSKYSLITLAHARSEDQIDVKTTAKIARKEMKLELTGGVDGGRGWVGDAKNMLLNMGKIKSLGWKPKLNSEQAVRKAIKHLVTELLP
jgi:UDP-glucose 4-epimerase